MWSKGSLNAFVNQIAAGGGGTWLLVGTTTGVADLGSGPLPYAGGADVLVGKLSP